MPKVINLRDYHGVVPPGAVRIDRVTKWGNPFRGCGRELALKRYREWLPRQARLLASLPELTGKDLACWCHPEECHGHILLELANPSEPETTEMVKAA